MGYILPEKGEEDVKSIICRYFSVDLYIACFLKKGQESECLMKERLFSE